jgi:hypothetical protein
MVASSVFLPRVSGIQVLASVEAKTFDTKGKLHLLTVGTLYL